MKIEKLPKAELHVHIIGTMQPEMYVRFAKRNGIKIPYRDVAEVRMAYASFNSLNSFLDLYFQITQVIKTELDFYELLYAYLQNSWNQGVKHIEIFFEIQSFRAQCISFETIIRGLNRARDEAHQQFGISCLLILCFLRDRPEAEALELLEASLAFQDQIIGIGLASYEKGHPPTHFKKLYKRAKKYGYKCTIHAGEDVGPQAVWQALELDVDRIDHGIASVKDAELMKYLAQIHIPLTVCPLSNVKLHVVQSVKEHPVRIMLEHNLCVSINSDDPAFFGSLNENYKVIENELGMNTEELIRLARNSFVSSFATEEQKNSFEKLLHNYVQQLQIKT